TTTLQAEVRDSRGKGPARRLRAEGKVPGVFYGPGVEPTPLTLSPKELTKALRGERGRNVVFKLSLGGKDELAMVKDLTTDPVTQELLHIDLYRILEDRVLEVNVPFRTSGRSVGVVQGGVLNVTRRVLPLRTMPANIPVSIEVDVTHLALKDTISVEDIELPAGVECTLQPKLTLVIILEPRKATAAEVEEDAAAAAAAEAAKPAAEPEKAAT
ncbi:MAG: 50S ribosomal protein L25, partial [Polyangiales bacterium]